MHLCWEVSHLEELGFLIYDTGEWRHYPLRSVCRWYSIVSTLFGLSEGNKIHKLLCLWTIRINVITCIEIIMITRIAKVSLEFSVFPPILVGETRLNFVLNLERMTLEGYEYSRFSSCNFAASRHLKVVPKILDCVPTSSTLLLSRDSEAETSLPISPRKLIN